MTRALLDTPELCAKLKIEVEWWYRHSARFIGELGFPARLPGFRRPRYDEKAVDLWLDSHIPADLRELERDRAIERLVALLEELLGRSDRHDALAARLDERAAAIGRGEDPRP